MPFEKTYAIEKGPPRPSKEEYRSDSLAAYRHLLETETAELPLHRFFERNPCFVPGARTPSARGGHDPMHCALISEPSLTGLKARRPDFLWIAKHSSTWFPTFIEIESPTKTVFRQDGVPTADFTQARNQLAQWRVWLNDPVNVAKFVSEYGIGDDYTRFRNMQPHFILVYGRRREFENDPGLSRQRGALMTAADEELISFDRLEPDMTLSDALTVRAVGDGRFRVEAVMPTITLGPNRAERLSSLVGLEGAIASDNRISPDRREFLVSRVKYWMEWSKSGGCGVIQTGDVE